MRFSFFLKPLQKSSRLKCIFRQLFESHTWTVKELVKLMQSNPTLIKKSVVIRGEKLIVGYDKSQIRTLIPKEGRL